MRIWDQINCEIMFKIRNNVTMTYKAIFVRYSQHLQEIVQK